MIDVTRDAKNGGIMKEITKIESKNTQPVKRKRVAAYARVSSGKDAQLHSLSAQISYITQRISDTSHVGLILMYSIFSLLFCTKSLQICMA